MARIYVQQLKNNCFIQQTEKDKFSLRLRIAGGKVTTEHLQKVYEIANKFGEGHIHLTSRQSIEIPHIKEADIEKVREELRAGGLQQGFCGAKIRTITACQGNTVCACGLIETSKLAEEFDELYYGNEVPHKFKIGITGCRNNCLKAEENDLGVKGAMKPVWHQEHCTACGVCADLCPTDALTMIDTDDGKKKLKFNEADCILCGRCVKKCPTDAFTGQSGYRVYLGGLFGNQIKIGQELTPPVYSKDELHQIIITVIEFFREHGKKRERLGQLLDRVGWELLKEKL